MRPAKYPFGCRTKREYIQRIKHAADNRLFFSRGTMRFFGRQKFDCNDDGSIFYVKFLDKYPRVTTYTVDPTSLKLRSTAHDQS